MNKQEALQRIEELQKYVESLDDGEFVFKPGKYFSFNYWSEIVCISSKDLFNHCLSVGNIFKTADEAEYYLKCLQTKQKVKNIAKRLNQGREINWNDIEQTKNFLAIDNGKIVTSMAYLRDHGCIYCLSSDFKAEVLKEISEQDVIDYIKSGV